MSETKVNWVAPPSVLAHTPHACATDGKHGLSNEQASPPLQSLPCAPSRQVSTATLGVGGDLDVDVWLLPILGGSVAGNKGGLWVRVAHKVPCARRGRNVRGGGEWEASS